MEDYRPAEPMDTRAGAGYAASWTTEGMSGETTVTEAEWLGCTDPDSILGFIQKRGSERKRRLFACACCRAVLPLIHDEYSRKAVKTAERYADEYSRKAVRPQATIPGARCLSLPCLLRRNDR
jgi:hypothetical protein